MTDATRPRTAWFLSLLLLACMTGSLIAGTLDDFEDDAAKAAVSDTTEHERTPSADSWWDWMDPAIDVAALVFWGGRESLMRMLPGLADTLRMEPRMPGEPQIPLVSLDLRYQDIESDVSALDGRGEVGYGPLGLALRYTHYQEERTADELDIFQWHGLYRMSFTEWVEVDVGYGTTTLSGDAQHSGSSLTLPVRIASGARVGLVFRPTWSWLGDGSLSDYDVGLLYSRQYVSVCLGYRWVECGDSTLNGGFLGVSTQL